MCFLGFQFQDFVCSVYLILVLDPESELLNAHYGKLSSMPIVFEFVIPESMNQCIFRFNDVEVDVVIQEKSDDLVNALS